MADLTQTISLPATTLTIKHRYVLLLPRWVKVYHDLEREAYPVETYAIPEGQQLQMPYLSSDTIYSTIDLITAVRLKLIKPGDDSGLGDHQWAWLHILGMTGEK